MEIKTHKILRASNIIIMVIFSALSLFPIIWMAIISFKPGTSVISTPPNLSLVNLTLENYKMLVKDLILFRYTLNSFIVAGTASVTNIIFATMAGYAFAKKEFFGKKVLFLMVIAIMTVSGQVIMIPLFTLIRDLGFLNSYFALILPVMVSPLYVFLAIQFIKGIHNELIYAAKIDGCNEWMIYMRIILPMSVPVVGIIAIFCFITQWNDFLWPMIVTSSKHMRTLPIGLASMQQINSTDYGYLMAGSVFASIPIIIIFLSFSRYFIKGLSLGGVKG